MDIETENWDTFVVGGLLTSDGSFCVWSHHREDDYVDALLSFEGDVWAHNGGRYDALWFLQHLHKRRLGAKVRCSGQRIITVETGGLRLRDSAALVPMSLAKASQMGSVRKTRTELPCRCDSAKPWFRSTPLNGCGGYCSIRRDMSPSDLAKVVSYLEQDCRATLSFMQFVIEFAEEHDLDLTSTVGASAYATAQRRGEIPKASWKTPGDYAFVRNAYFGGRTQVFTPKADTGFRYDINSAYPAALSSLSLPHGGYRFLTSSAARKAYSDGKPGSYRAIVHVPECFLPPLPVRTRERIAYPTGTFAGTWTSLELGYAESCGARIESISEGCVWDASEMVFAPFCRYIWDLRDKAGPKTALGTWLKWFANSLTGKLAQRPETEVIEFGREETTGTFCPANYDCKGVHPAPYCCKHRCVKVCGAWRQLARGVLARTLFRISECAHVHHAAFLTASTRVTLHKQLGGDGRGGLSSVYCDTDSVISLTPRDKDVGNQLGEWKEEGRFHEFKAIAPKTYAYIDSETGEFVARSKGIPDAGRNFDDLREGVTIDRGVSSFRAALRGDRGLFARKSLTRRVRGDGLWFGDRRLKEDGRTWPTDVKELRDGPE